MKKIFKMIGLMLIYLLTYFFVVLLVGMIASVCMAVYIVAVSGKTDVRIVTDLLVKMAEANSNLILVITNLIAICAYFLIFRIRRESLINTVKFTWISPKGTIGFILLGVSVSILVSYLMALIISLGSLDNMLNEYEKLMEPLMQDSWIMVLLSVGMAAPLLEELLFRGIIQNELKNNMPVIAALIIQGVLFGVYHMNPLQAIYTIPVGILLGLIYLWSDSIAAPIIVHASMNISSTFLVALLDEEPVVRFVPAFLILSLLIIVAGMIQLRRSKVSFSVK